MIRRILKTMFGVNANSGSSSDVRERIEPPEPPSDPAAWPLPPQRAMMLHAGYRSIIKGESNYQPAIARAAGRLGRDGPAEANRLHLVHLQREPSNQYDANAVRVVLGGQTVGYIPKEKTGIYHPILDWAASGGWSVLSRAYITGGFELSEGGQAHLGVDLLHASPPSIQYDGQQPNLANPEPRFDHTWSDIDVTGEQHHQECLLQRLFYMNVAELRPGDAGRIEVSIAGESIGRLTAKMSERYLTPLLAHIQTHGSATVFAKVRGTAAVGGVNSMRGLTYAEAVSEGVP